MSARLNKQSDSDKDVSKLRSDIEDMKAQTRVADVAGVAGVADVASQNVHCHEFDQLSPTEQSAASLGVNPSSWKPISFLNNKHYDALIKANMLDDSLARRIEAYRAVAST